MTSDTTSGPRGETPRPTAGASPPIPSAGDDIAGMKTARTGGVVRAGAVMAVATLVSRLTGFLAKVVIVSVLGFGLVNDAYTIANTLPNIIFELLIGGVLTSVAIPLLSRARADPDRGTGYTQRLMTMAIVGLIGATGLAIAAAPLLTDLYLSDDGATVDQAMANALAYLLLPQIFFYGIAALFAAILNTEERFAVPAWAPVANNLVVIGVGATLLLMSTGAAGGGGLDSLTREQYLILGLGTTLGIVVQSLVMLPALRRTGFRFRWRWGGDRRLAEAGGLMLWATGYVLVSQAGYIVTTNVASDTVIGGVAIYAFASLLFQLPYGIIGVSILTAIMPRMSRHAAAGRLKDVKDDAGLANRLSIVALTPVAAGIVVLASALAIISSFYGEVELQDALVLGSTLAALVVGLVPFSVTLVQMRVFYAMKDARTPTLINAVMVAVRIPLLIACASLAPDLVVPGLALATSVSYLVGAIVGEIWLRARYGPMGTARTLLTLLKMTVAGAAGAGAALLAGERLLQLEVDSLGEALVQIAVCGSAGLLVIAVVALLLRVEELAPVSRRIGGLLRRGGRGGRGGRATAPAADAEIDTSADETLPVVAASSPGPGPGPGAVMAAGARAAPTPQVQGHRAAQPEGPRHRASGPEGAPGRGTLAGTVAPPPTRGTPISREQVFTPVPNDSRAVTADGPAVDTGDTVDTVETVVGPAAAPADGPEDGSAEVTTMIATVATGVDRDAHPVDPADAQADSDPAAASGGQVGQPGSAAPAQPAVALTPGTTVGGRYRLVSLVASDAAGHWFWRAKDTVLPRDMAVTMLPDTTGTSATVARTLRAGRLHHIGLPQTLDVGTDHGQSYVVGQWVDGATLTDLLTGGPLEPDVATSITAKISEAVAEAHRNGIALGAISPSLVRVNFDGQVRLSHVIAHASATPDHDIRAIGALLYLMLTGTWPLQEHVPAPPDTSPGSTGGRAPALPPAPTRLGRELAAHAVRPAVPEALSALAERALHPEEPDGIHAVGAIAALLRSPDTVGAAAPPAPPRERVLSASDRRLIKERRIKLSVAAVVLGVFALLIVIALGGLMTQFTASIQNSAPVEDQRIDAPRPTGQTVPSAGETPDPESPPTTAPSEGSAASAVKVVGGSVYDPQGDGNPDYAAYVDRAYDGNPDAAWLTWVYKRQFPSLKSGVGLMLELGREVSPATVTITSATPGTVIEVRSATSPDAAPAETRLLGTATVTDDDSVTVKLTDAPKSKYLLLFVTAMSPTPDNQFQSRINEVAITGV